MASLHHHLLFLFLLCFCCCLSKAEVISFTISSTASASIPIYYAHSNSQVLYVLNIHSQGRETLHIPDSPDLSLFILRMVDPFGFMVVFDKTNPSIGHPVSLEMGDRSYRLVYGNGRDGGMIGWDSFSRDVVSPEVARLSPDSSAFHLLRRFKELRFSLKPRDLAKLLDYAMLEEKISHTVGLMLNRISVEARGQQYLWRHEGQHPLPPPLESYGPPLLLQNSPESFIRPTKKLKTTHESYGPPPHESYGPPLHESYGPPLLLQHQNEDPRLQHSPESLDTRPTKKLKTTGDFGGGRGIGRKSNQRD